MKPRIRKATGVAAVRQYWLCLNTYATGEPYFHRVGIGRTPSEAYAEWARFNHVD